MSRSVPFAVPSPRRADDTLTRGERRARTASLLAELGQATGERRDRLIEEAVLLNRPVAHSVASRFRGRGVEEDDVRQVAVEGLFKAVIRFDPSYGRDLLSFAVPIMRGEIRRHFRDHGWMIRPVRRVQEIQQQRGAVVERLGHELGRFPSHDEVAAALGVEPEEYAEVMSAQGLFRLDSLDQPLAMGEMVAGDLIPDDRDQYAAASARLVLEPLLRRLCEDEVRLLDLRFGQELTQSQIGELLGVSQAQVSRLLDRLLRRLRDSLEAP